jgi:hypothetical protein
MPRVTAAYGDLPDQIYVSARVFGPDGRVMVTADFSACGDVRQAAAVPGQDTLLLDLAGVPADCRAAAAGGLLTLALTDAAPGTQAEVYLSADPVEAEALASFTAPLSDWAPDTNENLAFSPLKAFD